MALAKIVFASMTGNTEEIADIVADKLKELGLEVDIDECTMVDAEEFDRAFAATGAEKGAENVKVDLSAEEEDVENLEKFAEELAAKVR